MSIKFRNETVEIATTIKASEMVINQEGRIYNIRGSFRQEVN